MPTFWRTFHHDGKVSPVWCLPLSQPPWAKLWCTRLLFFLYLFLLCGLARLAYSVCTLSIKCILWEAVYFLCHYRPYTASVSSSRETIFLLFKTQEQLRASSAVFSLHSLCNLFYHGHIWEWTTSSGLFHHPPSQSGPLPTWRGNGKFSQPII